ncbi:T9SS type A sorting domain-containing protein [Soonwooa sp.]|uniref:T9SS type A sorting domain-containing protein n=1 Tax=Soonwooa sp. TaxID=1938592 RepID=UPI0026272E55|nr:T9SS type A sorting domain-containing protein [Soonwooa sp.]
MKKVLFSLSLLMSAASFAQINYTEGFETDNGNFVNTGFFRSKFAQICSGEYALIRNLYTNAPTGNTVYSTFSSNGGAITASFKYRTFFYALQGGKVNGEMIVEYSKDGGANYTQIGKVDLTTDITTCATFSYTIPENAVPKNAGFKFRVTGNQKADGDFYLILDDFSFSQSNLAVSDVIKNDVKIYPNPVKNMLMINSSSKLTEAKITDFSGRLVQSNNLKDNKIDVSALKAGNYMITVTDENSKQTTTKFVKN